MAALPSERVYQGFWVDYTHGPLLGATITTTSSKANIVIAVLSLLVSFTGAHLWDLIAFTIYSLAVSNQPRSALHHQKQTLARNIASPGAYLLGVAKLGWAWRRHGAWLKLVRETALALFCSAGFLVAGIFVSQVVSTANLHVLVHSSFSGFVSWVNTTTDLHRDYQQTVFKQALTYSETCYNKSVSLAQCNLYAKQAIPIQNVARAECPFQGLCTNSSALRFDTGLLDSNDMFGINMPSKLRVQMQKVVTCAPLDLDRFLTIRPMPSDVMHIYENRQALPGELLYEWSVGLLTASLRPFNSSFFLSNYKSVFSRLYDLTPRVFYLPVGGTIAKDLHSSTFTPIPELLRNDADIHVLGIQNNGVTFYAPNEDPLFSAHKKFYVMFDDNSNRTMYVGDKAATFLGCAEQIRFCFGQDFCTSLTGVDVAYNQAQSLAPTAQHNAILEYLFLLNPTMYDITSAPMLVTRNAASFQSKIPSNQWELELRAWADYLLAITQTTITHLAAGPGIAGSDFDQLADPLVWPDLCSSQRMGAPDGFSNINVFSLALIVSVSGVIILTNLILVPTLEHLQKRNIIHRPHIASWIHSGLFQMLRNIYEGLGYTDWTHKDSDVPIISYDPLLPALGADIHMPGTKAEVSKFGNAQKTQALVPLTAIVTSPPAATRHHVSLTGLASVPNPDQNVEEISSSSSPKRRSSVPW